MRLSRWNDPLPSGMMLLAAPGVEVPIASDCCPHLYPQEAVMTGQNFAVLAEASSLGGPEGTPKLGLVQKYLSTRRRRRPRE